MIELPESCPRGRTDCQPLSQVLDDEKDRGFICCGRNDGENVVHLKDRFTFCFKGEGIDERDHWDERDLISSIAVMSQALMVDRNMLENEEDGEPSDRSV